MADSASSPLVRPAIQVEVVPAFPGYQLGGVILKSEFEYPFLKKEFDLLKTKLESTKEAIQNIQGRIAKTKSLAPPAPKSQTPSPSLGQDGKVPVTAMDALGLEKARIISMHDKILAECQKIGALLNTSNPIGTGVLARARQVPLPIDFSKMQYLNRGVYAEKHDHTYIKTKEGDPIDAQIARFIVNLHLGDPDFSPNLGGNMLQQVVRAVNNMLDTDTGTQQVFVIGSYVTLCRSRTLEPIVIKKPFSMPHEFFEQVKQGLYYLFTGEVLGGYFIGYGLCSYAPGSEANQSAESGASRISTFSYTSYGAIPDDKSQNLWETYQSWKQQLREKQECGYPIGFYVKDLWTIFSENSVEEDIQR